MSGKLSFVWKFSENQTSEIAERWFPDQKINVPDLLDLSVAVWNIRQLTHLWQMHVNQCGRNLLDSIMNNVDRRALMATVVPKASRNFCLGQFCFDSTGSI
ncbi:hypothetical protein T11_14146 [Trichinella zimbabwensis]|uniref:Uncharacterized protein n=1 Tax=Trichinella zimbabwensis TaxID=268475 RepID=A0A0V1GU95_9BILA|nr:hypothetical protein T11_14146 [Trichinella zimbabwensis]